MRAILLLGFGFAVLVILGTALVIDAEMRAGSQTLSPGSVAWTLLAISCALLGVVGWWAFHHFDEAVGARIEAITAQLEQGSTGDPGGGPELDGLEFRELGVAVARYIASANEAQRSSDERHRRLVELAPDGIVVCSRSSIKYVNAAALALSGATSHYDLIGVPIEEFLEFETLLAPTPDPMARPARWKRVDGTIVHVEVAEIAGTEDGSTQYLVRDMIDARDRAAAREHRAAHDTLTGLVNRSRYEARLSELLEPGSENPRLGISRQIGVLVIDIDEFRGINERYGYRAGNAVLSGVADRLRDSTRNSDLIARWGGDEFAVLLEVRDHEEVANVAARILASLEKPITIDGHDHRVRASIGIADTHVGAPEDAPMSAAELLRAVVAAVSSAKQSGGNRAAA